MPHLKTSRADSPFATTLSFSTPSGRILIGTLGALAFAGLTFLGANIRIPLQPVPITLQTLFVFLSGAVLGSRYGLVGQSFYVGLGALGLPIFADAASGLAVLSGPTGGYLLGFLVAPVFIGWAIGRSQRFAWHLTVFFFASMIILALGVLHLTAFYTHDLAQSLRVGYLPFIPGDLLKILAATSIYRTYRSLDRTLRRR